MATDVTRGVTQNSPPLNFWITIEALKTSEKKRIDKEQKYDQNHYLEKILTLRYELYLRKLYSKGSYNVVLKVFKCIKMMSQTWSWVSSFQ